MGHSQQLLCESGELYDFLHKNGLASAPLEALPMDASKRHYYRVQGENKLVMVCPPCQKPEQFINVSAFLKTIGLNAPCVLAKENDFYLIEDFGQNTYRKAMGKTPPKELYTLATDVLIHLKERVREKPSFVPVYDMQMFLNEAAIFPEWYKGIPAHLPCYLGIWKDLLSTLEVPECVILRDYHIDNLFYLPAFQGLKACGLIDFQDAVFGPVGYDLVSLLFDARTDVPQNLVDFLMDRYITTFPAAKQSALERACTILNMHRQLRILGVFSRLSQRDGKHHYLQYVPRILTYVRTLFKNPLFKDLKRWCDAKGGF